MGESTSVKIRIIKQRTKWPWILIMSKLAVQRNEYQQMWKLKYIEQYIYPLFYVDHKTGLLDNFTLGVKFSEIKHFRKLEGKNKE